MVVGADITHPGKMLDPVDYASTPSMAGIVATYDEHCVHYLASARLQKSKSEVRESSLYLL